MEKKRWVPYGEPDNHMEGAPGRGSHGWEARWEAGSAGQRPAPARVGPPVTIRLGFSPLADTIGGCN